MIYLILVQQTDDKGKDGKCWYQQNNGKMIKREKSLNLKIQKYKLNYHNSNSLCKYFSGKIKEINLYFFNYFLWIGNKFN